MGYTGHGRKNNRVSNGARIVQLVPRYTPEEIEDMYNDSPLSSIRVEQLSRQVANIKHIR